MNFAIAFHVPENSTPAKSVLKLDKIMESHFDTSVARVRINEEISDEIMYVIQRPLVNTADILREFFEKLDNVLAVTYQYTPHFTHPPKEIFEKSGL